MERGADFLMLREGEHRVLEGGSGRLKELFVLKADDDRCWI